LGQLDLPPSEVQMNRRAFLSLVANSVAVITPSLLLTKHAGAYPLSRILGANDHAYVSEYLKRMKSWYTREFDNPLGSLSKNEHAYIDSCISRLDRFSLDLPGDNAFEYFSFAHRVLGAEVGHGIVFAGTPNLKTAELKSKIDIITKARGAKIGQGELFGLGWDVEEKTFDVVELHVGSDTLNASLRALAEKHSTPDSLPARLMTTTYRDGNVVERKLTLAFKTLPSSVPENLPFRAALVSAMKVVSTEGRVDWFYRLKSFHLSMVAPHARQVALAHTQEFAQIANKLVWHSPDNCVLHYP
jgi:hypothetical protein